ncbi:MAG: hypothetical protein FWD49_07930 [Firmicutes bacterium]|nr:hypothetical protein [Bacillota bacterium]
MESKAMTEIREIRDSNSARHLKMTKEERRKEAEQALAWLFEQKGNQAEVTIAE